jgi:hypothetical protein
MMNKHMTKRDEPHISSQRGPCESNTRPANKPPQNMQNICQSAYSRNETKLEKSQSKRCQMAY